MKKNILNSFIVTVLFILFTAQNVYSKEESLFSFKFLNTIDGKTSGKPILQITALFIDHKREEIYIFDQPYKRIIITTIDGIYIDTIYLTDFKASKGAILSMTVHDNGNIYLAQPNRIIVTKYNGKYIKDIDLSSVRKKGFSFKSIDLVGDDLYIADQSNIQVIVYDTKKEEVKNVFTKDIKRATRLAAFEGGFFVLEPSFYRVYRFNNQGFLEKSFGKVSGLAGGFSQPVDIAVDEKNKRVIITDFNRNTVMLYDYDGTFIYEFGGKRLFGVPGRLSVDKTGKIYVADGEFLRVFEIIEQKVSSD